MNPDQWLSLLEKRHPREIELGLGRCGSVYARLGSPRPAGRVYTVAGTNGKGSTVAYLASMCSSLGQSCGTLTSPHIFRFNERIRVAGEPVTDARLVSAFEQVEDARGDVSLTYFEFTTLAGLLILNRAGLDCVVLEVGLGGRLDTVNLVDADCAVITPIGLDHQEYLGPDLDSIATEKAGIMRPGKAVVCTETDPPAPIVQTAAKLQAPLYRRGRDFEFSEAFIDDAEVLRFTMGGVSMRVSRPAMDGKHQRDNLAAALAALRVLNPGCESKAADISAAIRDCVVPGRLQKVRSSPDVLLDVGHNELAAQALAAYLRGRGRNATTCVLAMLADKSAEDVARVMAPVCKRWLCADTPGPRGQGGERLARRIRSVLPEAEVLVFGPVGDALQAALASAAGDETILVFGSFTTVAAAAEWLQHVGHDAARITVDASGKPGREITNG